MAKQNHPNKPPKKNEYPKQEEIKVPMAGDKLHSKDDGKVVYMKFSREYVSNDGKIVYLAGKIYHFEDKGGSVDRWVRRGAFLVSKEEFDVQQAEDKAKKLAAKKVEPIHPPHPSVDDQKAVQSQMGNPSQSEVEKPADQGQDDGKEKSHEAKDSK